MEYKNLTGKVIKKTPTLNPLHPINRFEGQSQLAIKLKNDIVSKLDLYTNVRSTLLLFILVFLLGKNLNWYLYFMVMLWCYLISYRIIRFWLKRWLMYMIDYCYPGNILMVIFILFKDSNETIFYSTYTAASSVISLAVITCDNQADLSQTDYLTSCAIHIFPLTTMWAIRWKHRLYPDEIFIGKTLISIGDAPFTLERVFVLYKLFFIYWILWAIVYFILVTKVLRKYAYSDLYESAICDFYKAKYLTCLLGDHTKNTAVKYLLQHLVFSIIVSPLFVLNFYCFYFNTIYLIFIVIYLGYNQSKKMRDAIRDALEKEKKDSQ